MVKNRPTSSLDVLKGINKHIVKQLPWLRMRKLSKLQVISFNDVKKVETIE